MKGGSKKFPRRRRVFSIVKTELYKLLFFCQMFHLRQKNCILHLQCSLKYFEKFNK